MTLTSFTEFGGEAAGVVAGVCCETCANAAPQANAQASALVIDNLVITPPREFYLCSQWVARQRGT